MAPELTVTRKPISDKLRFEVFKRDSFRCQYCGAAAPDVLLEIDHIKPVAEGGESDILNLVTACKNCNHGKGKHPLSDQATLKRQQAQLEELNERRQQLEMMIRWQEELHATKDASFERLAQYWTELVGGHYQLTDSGRRILKRLLTRFPLGEVMDAMRTATEVYLEYKGDAPTHESVDKAWSKVGGIIRTTRLQESKPYLRALYYIRGILRKRVYVNERQLMTLLEDAVRAGFDVQELEEWAKRCGNWTEFRDRLEGFIEAHDKQNGEGAND